MNDSFRARAHEGLIAFLPLSVDLVPQAIVTGVSCLALEEIAPPKQQIMSSRSFGSPIHHLEELREAVASYTG